MEYFEYFINILFDGFETFFKSFTIVSGKATLRVLYLTIVYLVVCIFCELFNKFTFMSIWSALLAVVVMIGINIINLTQQKDIAKFKSLLKGDSEDEQHE